MDDSKRTVVDISSEMHKTLKLHAIITGTTVRKLVDSALTEYQKKELEKDPKVKEVLQSIKNGKD